jgi:hypothetical protein
MLKKEIPNSNINSEKKLKEGGAEMLEESKIKNHKLNPIKRIFLPLTKIILREWNRS